MTKAVAQTEEPLQILWDSITGMGGCKAELNTLERFGGETRQVYYLPYENTIQKDGNPKEIRARIYFLQPDPEDFRPDTQMLGIEGDKVSFLDDTLEKIHELYESLKANGKPITVTVYLMRDKGKIIHGIQARVFKEGKRGGMVGVNVERTYDRKTGQWGDWYNYNEKTGGWFQCPEETSICHYDFSQWLSRPSDYTNLVLPNQIRKYEQI